MSQYSHSTNTSGPSSRLLPNSESLNTVLYLSDRALVAEVERIKLSNKRLVIESDTWESYLRKMQPNLLRGMDKLLNYAKVVTASNLPKLTSQLSLHPTMELTRAESMSSVTSGVSGVSLYPGSIAGSWLSGQVSGPRVNLTMRVELAKLEKDRLENQMASFLAKSKFRRTGLRCQLEELALQLAEIKEAREIFEQSICRDGIDHITGRIPAEKFVRYMEEWLKSADSIIEKLRLRTCTLQYKYISLRKQLSQKEELGENINPVDFDVLKIQNKMLCGTIDDKNIDLLKLKQKVGEVNLLLAKTQRNLQKQLKEKNKIESQIAELNAIKDKIEREYDFVKKDVDKSEKTLESIRNLKENYTVPELLDYVKMKKDVDDLRKDAKIWSRRTNLQKVALSTCVKKMKELTGSRECDIWYKPPPKEDADFMD